MTDAIFSEDHKKSDSGSTSNIRKINDSLVLVSSCFVCGEAQRQLM